MTVQLIRVSSEVEIPYLTYKGQPVVTFALIDKVHNRVDGTAKRNFSTNRKRFIEGEDYFHVVDSESLYEFRTEFPEAVGANAPNLILITECGYLMLVKSFTDGLSWQMQRQLVKLYFRVKELAEPPAPRPTLSAEQWREIQDLIRQVSFCCKFQEQAAHAAHERIRFAYGLRGSRELRPDQFEAAKADLKGVKALAEQHQDRMVALDHEFIAAVIRPPVSIRKVRAMAIKHAAQPPLSF